MPTFVIPNEKSGSQNTQWGKDNKCWVRITVSTQDSQSCNMGSIPVPSTNLKTCWNSASLFVYTTVQPGRTIQTFLTPYLPSPKEGSGIRGKRKTPIPYTRPEADSRFSLRNVWLFGQPPPPAESSGRRSSGEYHNLFRTWPRLHDIDSPRAGRRHDHLCNSLIIRCHLF